MHDSESVIQGHPWYKVLPHCVWWKFSKVTSILILLRQCSSVITMWSITDPRSSVTQHHPVKQRHLRFWGRIFLRGTFLTPRYCHGVRNVLRASTNIEILVWFEYVPRKFLDLVDFGDAAFWVDSIIPRCEKCPTEKYALKGVVNVYFLLF